ncbi:MAG: hypothetical protein ABJC26_12010 [Gemmatimonadaceae bacterium]
MPNGKILIHDISHKRVLVLDSTLSQVTVSADSLGTNGTKYPNAYFGTQLIPYLGDSTLFTDREAGAFVVIDPNGKFTRAMAHPKASDLISLQLQNAGVEGVDNLGRLIYRDTRPAERPKAAPGKTPPLNTRDTIQILRADFSFRTIDTIASFTIAKSQSPQITVGPDGKNQSVEVINPLPTGPDDWGVMSDGTVAVIRSHDYHIDFTFSDRRTLSSDKLPFDWRRLTDEDKMRRVDSTKHVMDSLIASGKRRPSKTFFYREDGKLDSVTLSVSYAPITELADYVPPFRAGALKPDADNNVWILPTTTRSATGGLLYDVVNASAILFTRVQLPTDRFVVGFGKGGVLYLAHYDRPGRYYTLERARVLPNKP